MFKVAVIFPLSAGSSLDSNLSCYLDEGLCAHGEIQSGGFRLFISQRSWRCVPPIGQPKFSERWACFHCNLIPLLNQRGWSILTITGAFGGSALPPSQYRPVHPLTLCTPEQKYRSKASSHISSRPQCTLNFEAVSFGVDVIFGLGVGFLRGIR